MLPADNQVLFFVVYLFVIVTLRVAFRCYKVLVFTDLMVVVFILPESYILRHVELNFECRVQSYKFLNPLSVSSYRHVSMYTSGTQRTVRHPFFISPFAAQ